LVLWSSTAAAALDCPKPPQNVAKEVVVDTEANVSGLGSLAGGSLKNHTAVTAKNLFEKYPHADRLTMGTLMLSLYCQQVDASRDLTDETKLDRFQTVFQEITRLMTAPQ
jgi:hypothetical protein